MGSYVWNHEPTVWDRIGDLLWGGGTLRTVLVMVGVMMVASFGTAWLLGSLLYGYQRELAPLCATAPTTVKERTVALYTGTVVADPSPMGRYRRVNPGLILDRTVLFIQVDGQDVPLALLARRPEPPQPGTRLQFCAVGSDKGHWWPLVGIEDGFVVKRIYGQPLGPFHSVKWVRDTEG